MAERLTHTPPLPTTSQELYAQFEKQISNHPLDPFELVTGSGNIPLAEKVGELLGKQVHKAGIEFADGERKIKIPENVRRRDVFILQSQAPNPDSKVLELEHIADATRRASADRISAVIPYYAYARQDRKTGSRESVGAARNAKNAIASGIGSILTVDLHNEATMSSIDQPWDNVYASPVLLPAIEATGLTDIDIASADVGGAKRAEPYLDRLDIAKNLAVVYKRRGGPNESKALFIAGNVEGRDLFIVEDIIDTAGTAVNAADIYKDNGARSVNMVATHGLFSRKKGQSAVEKIENSAFDRVIITDSILQDEKTQREIAESSKIQVVSIAPILAVAILCNLTGESIGERLIK